MLHLTFYRVTPYKFNVVKRENHLKKKDPKKFALKMTDDNIVQPWDIFIQNLFLFFGYSDRSFFYVSQKIQRVIF